LNSKSNLNNNFNKIQKAVKFKNNSSRLGQASTRANSQ